MSNDITKIQNNKEKIDNQFINVFFGFEETKVITVEEKGKMEYTEEYDEYDEQGYLIKAKNINLKLIEPHYEITVEKENNREGVCPYCSQIVNKTHDYYNRWIQDITFNDKPIFIKYRTKRFFCSDCFKSFSEDNRDLPKGIKHTKRLVFHIIERLKENCSRATIAREEHVSKNFVKKIIDTCAFKKKELGEALCIDEFKGNMGTMENGKWVIRKYQTILKNPENGDIIDILPSRDNWLLTQYFSKIPEEERKKVKYYICDMNPYFIKLGKAYFKNAKIIIDRFHYTEAIVNAFEKIRKGAQKYLTDKERKKFKNSRLLLLKHADDLKDIEVCEGSYTVEEMLEKVPMLKRPYQLLQQFYDINKSKTREEARMKLIQFYKDAEDYKSIFFQEAINTIKNHERAILDSFESPYTNAYAEGTNNLIKVIKRISYGLKNLERFKKRLELIENNYKRIKEETKEHKIIRQEIRRKRKEYRNKIKATIEIAA